MSVKINLGIILSRMMRMVLMVAAMFAPSELLANYCDIDGHRWFYACTDKSNNYAKFYNNNSKAIKDSPVGHLELPVTVNDSVDHPDSPTYFLITGIGQAAFAGCTQMTGVTIPSAVTHIDANAFHNCWRLESVELPPYLKSLGIFAFAECSNLTSVVIHNGVESVVDSGGRGSTFYHCVSLKEFRFPAKIKTIGSQMFYGCRSLERVTLPSALTTIGIGAFQGCRSLKGISLPEGLTTIDMRAFKNCKNLSYVVIPSTVKKVDKYAFEGCSGLKRVYVPSSLKGRITGSTSYGDNNTVFDDWSVVRYYDATTTSAISFEDGTAMTIPKTWFEEKCPLILENAGGDYGATALLEAANGRTVWECYVAGLNPMDATSRFEAMIEMRNGLPCIEWSPNLNTNGIVRTYTIYGMTNLTDNAWHSPTNKSSRFFKVEVGLP